MILRSSLQNWRFQHSMHGQSAQVDFFNRIGQEQSFDASMKVGAIHSAAKMRLLLRVSLDVQTAPSYCWLHCAGCSV